MSSGMDHILVDVARAHSEAFATNSIKSPWEYFEYSVKLALARWTALRMAMEGEWGGGDMRRKYEILLEEILHVFKYNKLVHADALGDNIGDYVESEFGLLCEDGSVEEVAELLVLLADECKKAQYDRVRAFHDQLQSLSPINLKAAKVKMAEGGMEVDGGAAALQAIPEQEQAVGMQEKEEPTLDEDGFMTVRRSSRRKAAPKVYDPAAEFPGAA